MGAVWLRFRTELRTRWPGALVLVVLVGIAGGAVLAALAGARRTASSFDRFHDSARSPDVLVTYPSELDARVRAAISRTPGVMSAAPYQVMAVFPAKAALYTQTVADIDGGLHHDFERGKLLEGRFERRGAVDEVALSEVPARRLGVGVGDTLELRTFTPEQLAAQLAQQNESEEDPQGSPLRLRVVGVYRSPFDLGAVGEDAVPLLLPRAVLREYRGRIGFPPVRILAVRLGDGEAGAPAFFGRFQRAVADRRVSLEPATLTAGLGDSLDVLALGLLLFAVVAGLAGLVAVGQALGRRAALGASDEPTLRALGMTGGQRFAYSRATRSRSRCSARSSRSWRPWPPRRSCRSASGGAPSPTRGSTSTRSCSGPGSPVSSSPSSRSARWPRGGPNAPRPELVGPQTRRVRR